MSVSATNGSGWSRRPFTCIIESLNAVEAWFGRLPGHVYANGRQSLISTLNPAHMMPLSRCGPSPMLICGKVAKRFAASWLHYMGLESAIKFIASAAASDAVPVLEEA
jgi:hypothetical protein